MQSFSVKKKNQKPLLLLVSNVCSHLLCGGVFRGGSCEFGEIIAFQFSIRTCLPLSGSSSSLNTQMCACSACVISVCVHLSLNDAQSNLGNKQALHYLSLEAQIANGASEVITKQRLRECGALFKVYL